MSLVLRETKGSPLTFAEMDGNLTYLQSLGNQPPLSPAVEIQAADFGLLLASVFDLLDADPAPGTSSSAYDAFLTQYFLTVEGFTTDGVKGNVEYSIEDVDGVDYAVLSFNGTLNFPDSPVRDAFMYIYSGPADLDSLPNEFQRNLSFKLADVELLYRYQRFAGGSGSAVEYESHVYFKDVSTVVAVSIFIDYDGLGTYTKGTLNLEGYN